MSTIITPLPMYAELPGYVYGTSIEGQSKQLSFYWNTRSRQWHMDIRNEDQTEVVLGVALVAGYPMLVDHPMESQGLTGYFILLCKITGTPPDIRSSYTVVPESYQLAYVYTEV